MGRVCSAQGRILARKREGNRPLGRPRLRQEDNIKKKWAWNGLCGSS